MSYLPQIESRLTHLGFFEKINKANKNISATATPCAQFCNQKTRRISGKGPSCVATALLLARPCPCLIQIESTAYMALHQSNNPTSGMKSQQPGGGRGVSQCSSVRLCSNCSPLGPTLPLSYLPQIESPGTYTSCLLFKPYLSSFAFFPFFVVGIFGVFIVGTGEPPRPGAPYWDIVPNLTD